ncbi:hypothetical protein KZO34_09040 [Marinobacter sp. F4206]|nr:hypothetical protein [Marinobacter sp. F4206]
MRHDHCGYHCPARSAGSDSWVIPGAGGPARLTRAVGKSKAMYYVLTSQNFDAEEAERIGVVTKVVAEGEQLEEALKIAGAIAKNPQLAVMAGKEAVNQQAETPLIPRFKAGAPIISRSVQYSRSEGR